MYIMTPSGKAPSALLPPFTDSHFMTIPVAPLDIVFVGRSMGNLENVKNQPF